MDLDFSRDYVLENDCVRLSPLDKSHLEPLLHISSDDLIWKYLNETGNERSSLSKYISDALDNRARSLEYPFVIFDKRKKKYAGTTRLYEMNKDLGNVKLGHTWLGAAFRGTGLNKSSKFLMYEFVFDRLKLERIGFGIHEDNLGSIHSLLNVGCKHEGALRSFLVDKATNTRRDLVLMSILRDEWISEVRGMLQAKLPKC